MKINCRIYILILILCLFLTSCENVVAPSESSSSSETQSINIESAINLLPETKDYIGSKLTVWTSNESKIVSDENDAGVVKNAIQSRNEAISTKYGISIEAEYVSEDIISEKLKKNALSAIEENQLLLFSTEKSVEMFYSGLLGDLYSLSYLKDLSSEFISDNASALVFSGKCYLLSDPTSIDYNNVYVVFYNRTLVRNSSLDLPESLVKNNSWSVSQMNNYSEKIAYSVVKKDSYDSATDLFGYAAISDELLPELLRQASGITPVQKDSSGNVYYGMDAAELKEKTAAISTLYSSKSHAPYDGSEAREAFEDGRVCFYIDRLSYINSLYENKIQMASSFDYGILPLPSSNAGQYITPIDNESYVYSIPLQTAYSSSLGLGLTSICLIGESLSENAEVDTYITLYSFDNDQTCMLETIIRSATIDFGYVYGSGSESIKNVVSDMFYNVIGEGMTYSSILRSKLDQFNEFVKSNFS